MTDRVTNVAVLGSTGSIGRSTLEVIAASGGRLRAVALSAHGNTDLLLRQAQAVRPRKIVVTDPGGGRPARLVGAARGRRVARRPRGGRPIGRRPGSGHRGFGHRRQRRPAGHLGRPGGRQDRGPGQQGEPGGGRAAGDRAGPPQKRQNPPRRQRTQRRVPGACRRGGGKRCGGWCLPPAGGRSARSPPNNLPK